MIISASRRTDIPAFFSSWFMERVRESFVITKNPYNPKQEKRVSLLPADVSAVVFWSKNPKPLMKHLDELNGQGFRYYFQFTLNDYPKEFEPFVPSLKERLETFRKLSKKVGSKKVVWRYDPIIISDKSDALFHKKNFAKLADSLEGSTNRVMISLLSWYKKTERNLGRLENFSFKKPLVEDEKLSELFYFIAEEGKKRSIEVLACSPAYSLKKFGIKNGFCIDASLVNELWSINYPPKKHAGQRKECLCAKSVDIGTNNSCKHGCPYCYSTATHHSPLS